jgi:hypothetical protein
MRRGGGREDRERERYRNRNRERKREGGRGGGGGGRRENALVHAGGYLAVEVKHGIAVSKVSKVKLWLRHYSK